MLPCITALPPGWSITATDITSGNTTILLNSDRAGPGAITVTLTAACDTSGAQQVPSGQPGIRRFDSQGSLAPRFYTFPGGCITYQFIFDARRIPRTGQRGRQRAVIPAPVRARRLRPAHRRPSPVRARSRMPTMSRQAAQTHGEQLLAAPSARRPKVATW